MKNLRFVHRNATLDLVFEPPSSLNLTDVDPEIRYWVDVYGDPNRQINHIISYRTTNLFYNFTIVHPHPEDLYLFVVTPQSNIDQAVNGTPAEINGSFFYGTKFGMLELTNSQ